MERKVYLIAFILKGIKQSIHFFCFIVGYILSKSSGFRLIYKQLMIMPDVNVVDEIKKHSFILHFFRKCYTYYLKHYIEMSTKSNREIQQDYWDREGYSHHTSKDLQIEWYNTPFQKKFYEFLDTFCGGEDNIRHWLWFFFSY